MTVIVVTCRHYTVELEPDLSAHPVGMENAR
jgi:hypothetical protein